MKERNNSSVLQLAQLFQLNLNKLQSVMGLGEIFVVILHLPNLFLLASVVVIPVMAVLLLIVLVLVKHHSTIYPKKVDSGVMEI